MLWAPAGRKAGADRVRLSSDHAGWHLAYSDRSSVANRSDPLICAGRARRLRSASRKHQFSSDVFEFLKASGIQAIRTSVRSPWQNGIAERWVGSARREVLDHVIAPNEQH